MYVSSTLFFGIFCSMFLLTSLQFCAMFLIASSCCFMTFFYYSSLSSWSGFWFFITYNSGILVMILYMSSLTPFKFCSTSSFMLNSMNLCLISSFTSNTHFITSMTCPEESHFLILEPKNFFFISVLFMMIIFILMFTTMALSTSNMPTRTLFPYSLIKYLTHN